jgi:hypothetical protein
VSLQSGYLGVETHPDHPGMIRLVLAEHLPSAATPDPDGGRLRFAARFNDSEAALMHAHELLRRSLVDVDSHRYRAGSEDAIAAIESLALSHHDVYLDPDLDAGARERIETRRDAFERRRRRSELIFQTLGYLGIGMLLFNMLVLSLG